MDTNIYRQEILEHARNPEHFGLLANSDIRGSEVNVSCGDEITLDLAVEKSQIPNPVPAGHLPKGDKSQKKTKVPNPKSKITQAGFEGSGCIVMLASADMLCGTLQGKTTSDIMALPDQAVLDFFGGALTPSRQTCALLPLIALRKAIAESSFVILNEAPFSGAK